MNNIAQVLHFSDNESLLHHNLDHVNSVYPVVCESDRPIPFQLPIPNGITHSVRRGAYPSETWLYGELQNDGTVLGSQSSTSALYSDYLPICKPQAEDLESSWQYIIENISNGNIICYYDANKNFLAFSNYTTTNDKATLTLVEANPEYAFVRIQLSNDTGGVSGEKGAFRFYPEAPENASYFNSVSFRKLDNSSVTSSTFTDNLRIQRWGGYDLVIWDANSGIGLADYYGLFQIVINSILGIFTSELIQFCDTTNKIKLTYYHGEPVTFSRGHINYADGYKSYMFLDAPIGKPEYPTDIQLSERSGYEYMTRHVSYVLRKIFVLLPEYWTDALRVVGGHKYVQIRYKGSTYNVDRFTPRVEAWEDRGDLADVTIEFATDTVVAVSQSGDIPTLTGDYDNDYNEDYTR